MPKMSSKEASIPWTVGYKTRHKSLSRPPKNRKWAHTLLGTFETWFSRIGIDRNFKPSKCSQEAVYHDLWYYDSAEIVFWSPQNADQELTRPSHSFAPYVSWLRSNRIFRTPNAENELIQRYVPLNRGFLVSEKSHFQFSKMKKIYSTKRSTLEQWVTRLGKNRIFMPPECRKWAYTKICTLEPFV